ncbi:MAG: molybdopterin-guanine dinucleotide biosynthesis protein B [Butyricicoccus sp.]|nr:molybdopterin-guanine dinucleotide biosynthesis protein B [Butyricicoccus sp.]
MTPVFSFIAYSDTGKTTYLTALIAELSRRGLRVGAIKHDAHEFEIDKPGKDSWRFAQAGAAAVAVASQSKCAVMDYRPVSFAETVSRIKNVDLIIAEGWHSEAENRIALYRSDSGKPLKLEPEQCLAVVSDVPLDTEDTPLFPLGDARPMADFLVSKLAE